MSGKRVFGSLGGYGRYLEFILLMGWPKGVSLASHDGVLILLEALSWLLLQATTSHSAPRYSHTILSR